MDEANNAAAQINPDQSVPHRQWTKEETDELFNLCRQYDLRFVVIHDRFKHDATRPVTVEQMKKRYYDIARKLAEIRIKDKEIAQKNPVIKTVYDYEGEMKRKQQLELVYSRPKEIEMRSTRTTS
jgi:DNA methyltransferase 1-associated protein 1